MPASPLVFEDVRVEPEEARVWRNGELVQLPPRAFSLLLFFASNPQRLLTKRELLDGVWPGFHVTEGVLKTTVEQLRRAFSDDARTPWLIATVPGRGYRFLPALRASNLPSSLTRFVGRKPEMQRIADHLRGKGLVTIAGAGGSGKTRLALEVAHSLGGDFERVIWVELGGVRDPGLLPHLLATELGVREHHSCDLMQTLGAACRARQLLLVLDNCEHLVEAVAALVRDLLSLALPAVAVLTTSREPLAIDGERLVHLPPLASPPPDADTESILASDAVRLFNDRARLVVPGFLPSAAAEKVAQICRRLDGMPLAIELAAARLRVLSLEQIAARLDQALDLLATDKRTAPARHRTLRATVEWSLRLLAPEERRLLGVLTTFAGSFTLEAAEAVADSAELPRAEVLAHLDRLVAKSVLEARRDRGGSPRFFLLETIRQALTGPSTRDAAARDRHLRFFGDLALAAAPYLMTGQRASWVRRLALEHDNLRAALDHGRDLPRERGLKLELAASLGWFWFFHGAWGEGRRQLSGRLDAWSDSATPAYVKALFGLGFLEFASGDVVAAGTHWLRCSELASAAGEPATGALALSFHSQIVMARRGDLDLALAQALEGAAGVEQGGGSGELAMARNNVGNVRRERGELGDARAAYEGAFGTVQEDDWLAAMLWRNLGTLEAGAGNDEAAATLFRRSLARLRREPEPWFVSRGLEELAAVESRCGRARRAARLFGAAETLRALIGAPIVSFYRQRHEAAIAGTAEALSAGELEQAWDAGRRLSLAAVLEEAVGGDAELSEP